MAKLKLSKQALHHEQEQLKLYKRLLPSLDLKRRQLTMEAQKAQDEYTAALAAIDTLETRIGEELPMFADEELHLSNLVVVKGYKLGEQNIVGVRLPVLESLDCSVAEYSPLTTPPWFDLLVQRLKDAKTIRMRAEIAGRRLDILRLQLRRVTQRVNLFEKILIPTAHENIQRIRIYLGEAERAAVVTSKLAKSKQLHDRDSLMEVPE
ncbi:MAG: V-type ATP synthase subunit D [Gammaproteobacteria bacterium]